MVNRNLIRDFDVLEDDPLWAETFGDEENWDSLISEWETLIHEEEEPVEVNNIVPGKVVRVDEEMVVVDVGYKSEGTIPRDEWEEDEDPPEVGQTIDVLVEDVEGVAGESEQTMIVLSKRKAKKIQDWMAVMDNVSEGDVVTGAVNRKIKGGLLVDIGVPVFLPASQVDIRRPPDIGDYIGRTIQCVVLKIDDARRNIVVSRRMLIEEERRKQKEQLLKELKEGDLRLGTVKNIADFGAFVDLGGIDGLLHITDMSWDRIQHPSEMVEIDQEIEIKILNIDYDREKIALGLKQKEGNPWEEVEEKYPVGSRIKGQVVNVMSYGAFVKLEAGIEGLVHISEMSWTKRVSHPNELVHIGDEVEVVVLGIDKNKQEISLGMKQTQANPWDKVADRYPPGTMVKGKVRNLTNYGAFIEIEEGIDGLLHVSDMSWTRKVSHPNEVVEKGQEVECKVLSVDQDRRRIALGLKQLEEDPWVTDIPHRYQPNEVVKGKVTKITNFGVFVGLEDGLEGLLHISELADHKVENPEEIVSLGDEIEVKVLRVDTDERKIGLSRKRVEWAEEELVGDEAAAAASSGSSASPEHLKGGVGSGSGPLFSAPTPAAEEETQAEASESEAEASESESEASESESEASEEESEETADTAEKEQ